MPAESAGARFNELLSEEARDRLAVRETLELYFFGDDAGDADALNECFTADVRARYDMYPEAVTLTGRQKLVSAMLAATSVRLGVNHSLCNTRIDIEADVARADTLAIAQLAIPDEAATRILVRGLRYRDLLVRTDDRWQIRERLHQSIWQFDAVGTATAIPSYLKDRNLLMDHSSIRGRRHSATNADELAIRELIERYFYTYDRAQEQELAECFAPDAEIYSDIGLPEPAHSIGREQIAREIAGAARKRSGSHHMPSNMRIEVDGSRAQSDMFALSYLAYGEPGDGTVLVRGLRYLHDFVRAPEGWQIRKHVHNCVWQFEAPLMKPVIKG